MKTGENLIAIALSAALTFGCAAMAACQTGANNNSGIDPDIFDVYTAYAEEGGTLSYSEWYAQLLESVKGEKGDKGDAGNSFLHGSGAPAENTGKAGDLYLDIKTWDIYERTESGWSEQPIGNIKGEQGEKGEKGETTPIEVTNETYGSFWLRCHDYKTMPIGAFNAVTAELSATPSLYTSYKEAGVNMMIGCWEGISIDALNLCADNGIGYLLNPCQGDLNIIDDAEGSPYINNKNIITERLAVAKYHEAFAGIMVTDEPGRVHFERIAATQEFLDGLMPESVKGALWWTNLYPNYATKKQLYFRTPGSGDKLPSELNKQYPYDRYLAEYMEICKPKVLSFDNYGYHVGVANRGAVRSDYFQNLSVCRKAALEANIPFWHFVQTCQFGADVFAPTLNELLWAVNTGLSFGAKGIEYFTGVAVSNFENSGYAGAMFKGDGTRTDVYNYVKEANAQIGVIDEVLMCSKSKGLIAVGAMPESNKKDEQGDPIPCVIPEEDLIQTYGELTSVEAKHALIGCFDYNGKTAFYVTNNSIDESDTVTLNLNGSAEGYTVLKATKKHFMNTSTIQLALAAGEGALIVIE